MKYKYVLLAAAALFSTGAGGQTYPSATFNAITAQSGGAIAVQSAAGTAPETLAAWKKHEITSADFAGCDPTGVTDSTTCLNNMLSAVPAAGAVVHPLPGTYLTSNILKIKSHTLMYCSPGTTFIAASSWSGADGEILQNANWTSTHSAPVDTDIEIRGCGFNMSNHNNGVWHGIGIAMAQRVRISNVQCLQGGGDCTALMGVVDSVVENSEAGSPSAPMLNACWDHWSGGSLASVAHNTCYTALYGVMFTGTSTNETDVLQFTHYNSHDNHYFGYGTAPGVLAFVNGLGGSGSGASYGDIHDEQFNLLSSSLGCAKYSGLSQFNTFHHNSCLNGANAFGVLEATDTGGQASQNQFDNNNMQNIGIASGNIAALSLGGDYSSARENTFTGSYPYAIYMHGTGNTAAQNRIINAGTSGNYNWSGAANVLVEDQEGFTTIGSLPASPRNGMRAWVTNGSGCSFGSAAVTTGSSYCPVGYNSSAWVYGF